MGMAVTDDAGGGASTAAKVVVVVGGAATDPAEHAREEPLEDRRVRSREAGVLPGVLLQVEPARGQRTGLQGSSISKSWREEGERGPRSVSYATRRPLP